MKKSIYILSFAFLLLLLGCKESVRIDLVDESKPAPVALDEVMVKSILGGAVLKYQIPNDKNLLCIKAVYEISPGHVYETKSSVYVDSLVLKGFASSETTQVKVYSVGKNGKESKPLIVEVTPGTPVVEDVANTLFVRSAIGGVKLSYANLSGEDLIYDLIQEDIESNRWEVVKRFYSGLKTGEFTQRGMESKPTNIGVLISDRWGNISDTIKQTITPVFEEEVPKPWSHKEMVGDSWKEGVPGLTIDKMWDGRWDVDALFLWASSKSTKFPQSFTIDLKCEVEITRIVEHQRPVYAYLDTSVKEFELFGTTLDNPNPDTNSDDWIKLGRFSSFQPSGLTGSPTKEDFQYGNVEGENFEFLDENGDPKPTPPVRYLRWRTYETWDGQTEMGEVIIAELEVYGKILKK
ncbi:DUF4959 domain-containing protein [Bacteroides faecalis]|uniref:DUF4959 domain-containing protein n=1 Tax=Bacteroides faecalis TaxID=2447885 RepID=A0A401LY30_9BACE|nr:DUF4959 domain-containing protein [Bacteroides faecalis]GCB36439.1 hypothetical protein KGMB02408_33840 [Bacteroides faecalis]